MVPDYHIPEPILFNPLKHHLGYIREFINLKSEDKSNANIQTLIKDLKHVGKSVMDLYTGSLSINDIYREAEEILKQENALEREAFLLWVGNNLINFKIITLSDGSKWTIKINYSQFRFIHIFPARYSLYTIRAKGNTLKSAILYNILIGKNFIAGDDLNTVRLLLNLSPVKGPVYNETLTKMIEILRD